METWQKPSFRSLLQETSTFVACVELVNSRGIITERGGTRVLKLARELSQHPQIHALCITDNAGGNAMLSADTMGTDLISRGQEVVIHLSCKDWNRNGLQSQAWKLASEGFDNVLALSGDYPVSGYKGQASAVFDIDSVGLLKMISEMNTGLEVSVGQNKKKQVLKRTRFFSGAVVNNHKRYEREVMPQYFKLKKKIENGASFIVNQIGYDARKQDELLKYMNWSGLHVPVLYNVYVLSLTAARFFHANNIPGVTVTDDLLALVVKQADSVDKGKAFFLEFAAKQCAIAKGLGFRGVYLGGHLKASDYKRVLEIADQFGEDDWQDFAKEICFSQTDEFYFFEPDIATKLSSTEINREYLHSKHLKASQVSRQKVPLSYKINRTIHDIAFKKGTVGFGLGEKISRAIERKNKGAQKIFHGLEQTFKIAAFDCQDCGDCSLPDIAFLCPESQCVKNQRNGPCGGTKQGKCEVGEKECIWSLAYDRLKAYDQEEPMLDGPVVFRNGALKGTSAWINTFLGRDHHGKDKK